MKSVAIAPYDMAILGRDSPSSSRPQSQDLQDWIRKNKDLNRQRKKVRQTFRQKKVHEQRYHS